MKRSSSLGLVSIVGAGPGDPELLTVRAQRRLEAADLVLYDGLVPRRLAALATRAVLVSVARRHGPKSLTQEEVTARIIAGSRAGRRVVRLKAGDPFVFGRGGEEIAALALQGIPFEIVPGLSTALVAPAMAGIPVTYRGVSSAVIVVSGHGPDAYAAVLDRVAPGSATIVVLMGLAERRAIARCLKRAGWPNETPAAIVINASRRRQRVWTGTLAGLGVRDDVAGREDPGVLVVGQVVALSSGSPERAVGHR